MIYRLLLSDFKFLWNKKSGNKLYLDGFVTRESFLSEKSCDLILARAEQFVADPALMTGCTRIDIRDSHDGQEKYDTGMVDMHDVQDSMKDLLTEVNLAWVQNSIEEAAGSAMQFTGYNVYLNKSVTNTRCFHIDAAGVKHYKAFIYLTDVNSESEGPYAYIQASHRHNLWRYWNVCVNFLKGYPIMDMRHSGKMSPVVFLGKKGTLLITSQDGMHRGIPQSVGAFRGVLVMKFVQVRA
jgi:hypothetical protein